MGQKREREQKMNKPRFGAKAETLRRLADRPRSECNLSMLGREKAIGRPTSPPHFVLFYFLALPALTERERSGRGGAALISTPQPPPQAKAAGMVGDATAASLRLSVVVVAIRQSGSLTPSPSLCQPTSPRALVSGSATMTASAATAATSSRSVSAVPQENEEARREEQPRRSSGAAAVQWQNLHGHRATACKEKN